MAKKAALIIERKVLAEAFEIGRRLPQLRVGPPTYCRLTAGDCLISDGRQAVWRWWGEQGGEALYLGSDRLGRIVQTLPDGPISFGLDGKVRAGRSEFRLPVLDAADLPHPPMPSEPVGINGARLAEAIEAVKHAACQEEARSPLWCGVGIHPLPAGGTRVAAFEDGRMAVVKMLDMECSGDGVVIPNGQVPNVVKALVGANAARWEVLGGSCWFLNDEKQLAVLTDRLSGDWPDLEGPLSYAVPGDEEAALTVERDAFLAAIEQASLCLTKDRLDVRLTMPSAEVLVVSGESELGAASIELPVRDHEGWLLETGTRPAQLKDALIGADEDVRLTIGASGGEKDFSRLPIIIQPEYPDRPVRLIMPVILGK